MRILVIDADEEVGRSIALALCEYDVVVETDLTAAISHCANAELAQSFDLVLCDYLVGRMNSRDVMAKLRAHAQAPVVILMSSYPDAVDAAMLAEVVVIKPISAHDLIDAISRVL